MNQAETAEPSISQRAARGAGWIIAWRLATRNIGLLSTLVLVRLLQPSDFGLVALATGFISSVDALSAIGVQDALVRTPKLSRALYDTGFGLSVLRGLLTASLIATIAWPVAHFFNDPRLTVVMLALSAGTLISAFENIGIVDFRRELAFRKEFDMQLWSRVIGTIATITVAAIWRTYWALVAGILVYRVVRLAQSYLMSAYRPQFSVSAWRQIIGFSLWTWAQTMLYQARDRTDGIVIGRLLGTGQVGEFSVGMELGSLPTTELVEPLGRALFSSFASLHNSAADLGGLFLGAVGLGLMVILPAGVGISMVADPMVRLSLGEHWLAAVPVVEIMAIGGIAGIFTQTCSNLLNAVGRPHVNFYVGAISTVVKLGALLLLIPFFGLAGAAGAVLLSCYGDLVMLLWMTLPRIQVSLWQLVEISVRPMIATVVMVIVLRLLGMAWTQSVGTSVGDYAWDAAVRSASGAGCYSLVLLAAWLASGRPDGAEQHVLRVLSNTWKGRRRWV